MGQETYDAECAAIMRALRTAAARIQTLGSVTIFTHAPTPPARSGRASRSPLGCCPGGGQKAPGPGPHQRPHQHSGAVRRRAVQQGTPGFPSGNGRWQDGRHPGSSGRGSGQSEWENRERGENLAQMVGKRRGWVGRSRRTSCFLFSGGGVYSYLFYLFLQLKADSGQ